MKEHEHWKLDSDCPTRHCYVKIPISNCTQAWALGQYTIAVTETGNKYGYFGERVHSLKYEPIRLDKRETMLDELTERVMKFSRGMNFPVFDAVVTVPGNRVNTTSNTEAISKRLVARKYAKFSEVIGKLGTVPVMKGVERSVRAQALSGKYYVNSKSELRKVKTILLIDDVYDTGSTLQEATKTLVAASPKSEIYVLALTYLRDPKESA